MAILASGAQLPFEVTSVKLDLPELQGEPEEISKEKCRIAAKEVLYIIFVYQVPLINRLGRGRSSVINRNVITKTCFHNGTRWEVQ